MNKIDFPQFFFKIDEALSQNEDCLIKYLRQMSLIILSIPMFFLLIGIELLISKSRHLPYYRFNDTITNLSCGVGSQVSGLLIKVLTLGGYYFIYNYSPCKGRIPTEWWMWVLLFVAVDFFYYWFHRLAHEVSVLWGSHVVHHQSEEYNLTVALRQAWFQGAFSWVFYLPLAFVGFEPKVFLTVVSINTLYQFWIHTRLIGKMHPAIEYVFNTPSHHRVHHGVNPKYIDRNHGGTFIIYDRMFGTFQEEEEEVVYGITSQPRSWNPLWLNFEYWIDLFKEVASVRSWKNKLKMLLMQPGWKPAELGGTQPYKAITTQEFKKYNTTISAGLSYYVFFQYILLIVGTSAFLFTETKPPFNQNLLLKFSAIGLVVLTVVSMGGMFEHKRWVMPLEYLRFALLIGFIFALQVPVAVLIATSVVAVVSIGWFSFYLGEFKTA